MLSIIICSRRPDMLRKVSEEVARTVGTAHEIIAIDNSRGEYGICQAYNLGAARSRYELLCFMHEDLAFHTPDWGKAVAAALADETIGVLGVAGSTYQVKAPVPWWFLGPEYVRMRVLHSTADENAKLVAVNRQQGLADVAVVDGLWFCSPKRVWRAHPFDEATFPDFHFYDIDYCTAVFPHHRVCVTFDLMIEHFSKGSVNAAWSRNALHYQQKWQSVLPFGPAAIGKSQNAAFERRGILNFLKLRRYAGVPPRMLGKLLTQLFTLLVFNGELLGAAKQLAQRAFLQRAKMAN